MPNDRPPSSRDLIGHRLTKPEDARIISPPLATTPLLLIRRPHIADIGDNDIRWLATAQTVVSYTLSVGLDRLCRAVSELILSPIFIPDSQLAQPPVTGHVAGRPYTGLFGLLCRKVQTLSQVQILIA